MPKVNHCIHGTEIDSYCPACVLDVRTFENWTGVDGTSEHSVVDLLAIATDY